MKQIIAVFFSIIIGVFIYKGLVGNDEESIKNISGKVYEQRLKGYRQVP